MAAGGTPPHLLLQPACGNSPGEALAVAFVQSHPAWRLSLQSHKCLGSALKAWKAPGAAAGGR